MNAVKKFIVAMLVVLGLGIVFFIGYFVKSNANLKHDARNNTCLLYTSPSPRD